MLAMYMGGFSILILLIITIVVYLRDEKYEPIEIEDVLLTKEELMNHGRELGIRHNLGKKVDVKDFLISNLDKNFREIEKIYLKLNSKSNENKELPRASEWLLDNFYIIELQYKGIRRSLKSEKEMVLNVLAEGQLKGYPRVYILALELISHTEGAIIENDIVNFVNAYQRENTLSIKEVSSINMMLSIALLEYTKNTCEKIYKTKVIWDKADAISLSSILDLESDMAYKLNMDTTFLQRIYLRLRKTGEDGKTAILDKKLNYLGTSIKNIIENEYNRQSITRLEIGNCITSLKNISNLDWESIFENLCIVEGILKKDPLQVYENMDLETKNYYRFHIEKMAKSLKTKETVVAKIALELAMNSYDKGSRDKESHIGYYIIDKGRSKVFESLGKKDNRYGLYFKNEKPYTLSILILSLAVVFLLARYAFVNGGSVGMTILVGLITFIPVLTISISIVNRVFFKMQKPVILPKLKLREGIPEESKTFVVIPTLLPNEARVREMVEQMEVHFLSNKEKNLYFALVGDFKDGDLEHTDSDEEIIETGLKLIRELNKKYNSDEDIFYYFHRCRTYSQGENKWMGWERKRGALVEFNSLILGDKDTSFSIVSSDISHLVGEIKYIITLDADTKLPLETAKKLIGTISHPLNIARVDEERGIVTEGYGLIQPRIVVDVESSNKSTFSRIYAGQGGMDAYTTAISDIYQDLFGEGIFTGKGIYDLKVFQRCLKGAIPENTVLSHDLLEGSYIRTGLATDIELIDGYPEKYTSYMMRLHRWVRGDWQLIRWLNLGKGNPISSLSRWKIFDNLRRSTLQISLLLLTLLGLTVFPGNTYIWMGLMLLVLFSSHLLSLLKYITDSNCIKTRFKLNGDLIAGVKGSFYQALLTLMFIPYEACLMLDAIFRTLYRVYFSKTNLLEWTTAFDMEKKLKNDLKSYIIKMKSGPIFGVLAILLGYLLAPQVFYLSVIIGILWLISPIVAYKISTEKLQVEENVDVEIIKRIARKTWEYYETFTNAENNYLPPDNFQEYPYNGLAYRTSPTNIGFLLLSIMSARDMGYITTSKMLIHLDNTISTIEKMDKWEGHLYNWYSTTSLQPLKPYFVSTVDSGNFVSYLYVLKEGLLEYLESSLIDIKLFEGIEDTIKLIEDEKVKEDISILIGLLKSQNDRGLKGVYNQLVKIKEKGLVDEWLDNCLHMVDSLLIEYDNYLPNDETIKILEYNFEKLGENTSLYGLRDYYSSALENVTDEKLIGTLKRLYSNTNELILKIESTISRIDILIEDTRFAPLYDNKKDLFSIGYFVEDNKMVNSYYDLLASEARIASYIAICRGEVPKKHWYKLNRSLVLWDGYRCLASWTGTMFEYLMPILVMKNYKNTLLDESYRTAIRAQREYSSKKGLPWGISESGFFAFDINLNYQYRAFGLPQLGFKRGLKEDLVISPYASMLALNLYKNDVVSNMKKFIEEKMEGQYGFYEAIDYTVKRLPVNMEKAIVKSYMTHHQGMIFLSINNYMNRDILIERFHRNPVMKCGEILLQEKIPMNIIVAKEKENILELGYEESQKKEIVLREYGKASIKDVKCHILSSGNYSIFITNSGTGYSKRKNIHLYRWRKDSAVRPYGFFIYIKDLNNNRLWSTTYEPTKTEPKEYEVRFSDYKVSYFRSDDSIETQMDVVLFPEEDGEIRKVTLTNSGKEDIILELFSYLEITGDSYKSDLAHPVFNSLFIRTELLDEYGALLANRRNNKKDQTPIWMVHVAVSDDLDNGGFQYETSRTNFVGRGNELSNPQGAYKDLTNTVGTVLDPIMSLKKRLNIKNGESKTVYFITGIFNSKENAMQFIKKYRDDLSLERAFELAFIRSQTEIGYLEYKPEDIKLFDELLPNIIFIKGDNKRKNKNLITKNTMGQEGLWAYGISGDNYLILLRIKSMEGLDTLRTMLKAHRYWNQKGLLVDLVILNEDEGSYYEPLFEKIHQVVYEIRGGLSSGKGNIFIIKSKDIDEQGKILLFKWADMIINGEEGIVKESILTESIPFKEFSGDRIEYPTVSKQLELKYFNGYGGFSSDGNEYTIILSPNMNTPLPWVNVIANRNFGFLVTENGTGFTWAHNSRENKLTPWYNDPYIDVPSEVIYIRDNESGEIWTITPAPIRESKDYIITHGQGYTRFNHHSHGLDENLTMYVSVEDNVKINLVKLVNDSPKERKLSIIYYLRPVLGVTDEFTAKHIETYMNEKDKIFTIKNTTNTEFGSSSIYISTSEDISSFTGDRSEFFGSLGNFEEPEGVKRESFSNTTGLGYDPCCAIQINITLSMNTEKEIVFLMGESMDKDTGYQLIKEYREIERAKDELYFVKKYWREKLGKIKIETPDDSMNILMNSWLMYQTISSRVWARAGFYQVGGAYGARDQIQDVMNAMLLFPEECRKQILNVCRHQFVEGDVQHWWHPTPLSEVHKGIRSRYSDDLLWLPYVVSEYVKITGDVDILREEIPFIESEILRDEEHDRYEVPSISKAVGSVYEHCKKAIDRSLIFGERGIPLMKSGDWNDGMNNVGSKGRGESIWLGWFLGDVLQRFVPLCKMYNDVESIGRYTNAIDEIKNAIDNNAWDGEWYLRAYFDDGTPLGSKLNDECRIDSISQSWGILSALATEEKREKAMKSLEIYLVNEEEGIILLLTPPFDEGELEPGYIKSYVPGVRENGGQYTHAAAWVIGAFALMGKGDTAIKLFNMINPINHTRTFLECSKYKVEPYVLCADVYSAEPHVGRGGWTWYTGSAGWYYKVGLEYILGFKKINDRLYIDPCISKEWQSYKIKYRYLETNYNIEVKNPYKINKGISNIKIDGKQLGEKYINLINDGREHFVEVIMGSYKMKLK